MSQCETPSSPTDYAGDDKLREISKHTMDIEAGFAKHYETQRFQVVNLIILITGAALAFGTKAPVPHDIKQALPWALAALGGIGFFMAKRLSQGHWFHYMLYLKARSIVFRGHPKLLEKQCEVKKKYKERTRFWAFVDQDVMWELVALIVPLTAALYLWGLPACFIAAGS